MRPESERRLCTSLLEVEHPPRAAYPQAALVHLLSQLGSGPAHARPPPSHSPGNQVPTCRLRSYISCLSAARPTALAALTSGGWLCGQGGRGQGGEGAAGEQAQQVTWGRRWWSTHAGKSAAAVADGRRCVCAHLHPQHGLHVAHGLVRQEHRALLQEAKEKEWGGWEEGGGGRRAVGNDGRRCTDALSYSHAPPPHPCTWAAPQPPAATCATTAHIGSLVRFEHVAVRHQGRAADQAGADGGGALRGGGRVEGVEGGRRA